MIKNSYLLNNKNLNKAELKKLKIYNNLNNLT